jgi:hypothetical protein
MTKQKYDKAYMQEESCDVDLTSQRRNLNRFFPVELIWAFQVCKRLVLGVRLVGIIIIIIIIISFMQSIYNYMPETNHVSREYSAAAIL